MGFGNYGKSTAKKDDIEMKVLKKFGKLSADNGRAVKELRLISWNKGEPKFDLRPWKETEDGEKCMSGITLTSEEIENLYKILTEINNSETEAETGETE